MNIKSPPRSRGFRLFLAALVMGLAVGSAGMYTQVRASDHDDGETNIKGRNLNLTDVYAFREDWQTGNVTDSGNLILIMNTNPRSLPRQQYFFNTNASYNFNIGRQTSANATVTGNADVVMGFTFGAPNANSQQAITMSLTSGGTTATFPAGLTTASPALLTNSKSAPSINNVTVNGQTVTVFAGLREDPFFFDVNAFFRTRAAVAANSTSANPAFPPGFGTVANSTDFTLGFNVNAIVVRVPIALLQTAAGEKTFDTWATITLPSNIAAFQ